MDRDSQKYWLALNMVVGVGKTLFHRLVATLGSPHKVFQATRRELQGIDRLPGKTADQILGFDVDRNAEREFKLVEAMGAQILTLESPDYPELLKSIYDPPPVLYYKGKNPKDLTPSLAVVGTRLASSYGKIAAERLCGSLASMGLCIVSGMARGIDTIAHKAALEAGGSTLAVFGCGLDLTYPPENGSLKKQIIERGAILSEFPMSSKPDRNNFPARNRVISGLSHGTLVIEAGQKSGALITAQFSLEQGREVFSIPGNIYSGKSQGTNQLIKMGAKLVDSPEDVVEELPEWIQSVLQKKSSAQLEDMDLSSSEKHLMSLLSVEEQHIDNLIENSYLSPAQVSATLIQLELKGMVRQAEGKMFITNCVEMD